ncbi:enoyl-CoA hydratase/isomerase family protein [Nocardioides daejeonensis]|uniref:enoyl-CoA hydratase/isomerase family protein n=1 Tax=Nocardioides daejeonensis TaxID=1046556 RepID=UPI000D749CE6|nr:enoyl-CoA hydratase/isomerase family protein [Nocardioides daejeonensis]
MTTDAVVINRRGPVLHARINRADSGNACSSAVMAGLEGWLEEAHAPEVRALVLTGTGRSFCAGADMAEGTALLADPKALQAFLRRGRDLVFNLRSAPVPTVAAVNGAAYGGGLELTLACDIAIAGQSARLGDRHLRVGQVPGWGSSAMLPSAVGQAWSRRLLLTAEALTAAEAASIGLVTQVVPDDELDAAALRLATSMAEHEPEVSTRMLRLARASRAEETSAWDLEWQAQLENLAAQRPGPQPHLHADPD